MTKIDELAAWADGHDFSAEISRATPRSAPKEELMISSSIRLTKSIMDQVRARAQASDVPTTTLMRQWILDRLAADPGESVVSVVDLQRLIAERAHSAKAA